MKLAILCLCLAATACAAPFQYLPHYRAVRPQPPVAQVTNSFTGGFPQIPTFPQMPGFPQPAGPGAYSVELIYPHRFPGAPSPPQPFGSFGFIKYSIPQPPGRQSVEVYYPYDFAQQRIVPNLPPMSNNPPMADVVPFEFPPQNVPQQNLNNPSFDVNALPSEKPLPTLQQDQPPQTSQMPAKI